MKSDIIEKANELYDLLSDYKEKSIENHRDIIETQIALSSLIEKISE